MNKPHRSPRAPHHRFAKRLGLAAMCVGAAYGCAASNAEAEGEAALAAEGEGDVTPAGFGTVGPVPTVTVTTQPDLPPVQFAYHATLDLDNAEPGEWQMARDILKRSPYRVRLKNAERRTVQISVRMDTTSEVNPITCAQYQLQYTVEGHRDGASAWVQLAARIKTGSYSPGTGNFPVPHCNLKTEFEVDCASPSTARGRSPPWPLVARWPSSRRWSVAQTCKFCGGKALGQRKRVPLARGKRDAAAVITSTLAFRARSRCAPRSASKGLAAIQPRGRTDPRTPRPPRPRRRQG
jgi:hypothetical protein